MATIEKIDIVWHLDRPALSLRVKRPDAQPLTLIYELYELPVTIEAMVERLKWLISRLVEDCR